MFESYRNYIDGVSNIWLGTDKAFEEQVIKPLELGTQAKHFNTKKDAEAVGTASTCIKVLSEKISSVSVNIYSTTDKGNLIDREDYRFPLLSWSPDGIITSRDFFSALEYNRALKGNSFARIYRDSTGRIQKIMVVPSTWVEGYKVVRGQIYYKINTKLENGNTRKDTVNGADLLHFKWVTRNGFWGVNPIEQQRANFSTLWKAKGAIEANYDNNSFIGKVLKSNIPDANLQKIYKDSREQWNENYRGVTNTGKIPELPAFTEIQELGMDPIDEKFLASMKFDSAQVASFYGLTPFMVGIYESGRLSKVEEELTYFKEVTMQPIFYTYKQELENKILTREERMAGKTIHFNAADLIATDLKTKVEYYQRLFQMGVISGNQIALETGYPFYEGGDNHFIPANNLVPIQDVSIG